MSHQVLEIMFLATQPLFSCVNIDKKCNKKWLKSFQGTVNEISSDLNFGKPL